MDHRTDFNLKVIVKIIEISMQNNEIAMFGCRDFMTFLLEYSKNPDAYIADALVYV